MGSSKLIKFKERRFNLQNCVTKCANLLAKNICDKDVKLVVRSFDMSFPTWVVGDKIRLKQILINLINNAIKFTHKGGIYVTARVVEDFPEAYRIQFDVQDTGIGIPASKLNKLFKVFSQLDSSLSRKYGGTGIIFIFLINIIKVGQKVSDLL